MRRFVVFATALLLLVGVSASVGDQIAVQSGDLVCETQFYFWWAPSKQWVLVSNRGVVSDEGVVWREAAISKPLQSAGWDEWYDYSWDEQDDEDRTV